MPKNAVAWGQVAAVHNEWAWLLATCPNARFRDPRRAVELAKRAVELAPEERGFWNTLGVAHCRAGNGKQAIAALEKSMKLCRGGDSFDWFFVAMAHWQLGEREHAMKWYRRAVEWQDRHKAGDAELRRFRAEAALLLGVQEKKK
jgi:uncharacterized protein HemY